ncbi:helicase [Peribacillus loiseleuriae]|uniref:Helicase n=1 Tax=Peribacillus loiseleuriae TaxID=1679170 RepID=A0A0K9H0J1_9BACI|nr:helicase [Peribacillus loiseleuriae]
MTTPYSPELQHHLSGRLLLAAEIPFSPERLTEHIEAGYVTTKAGVSRENGKYDCSRCSNRNQQLFYTFPCKICQKNCTYCRSCIMMGRVSECSKLYLWIGPELHFPIPPRVMAWAGTLSDGQKTASDRVVAAVEQNEEVLIWAVCGAGKTEVLFKGMETAISSDKRVCICTPRTDVVLELTPRLKRAFPNVEVAALYGGSEDRHLAAPLTVSTTHQLYRFSNAFDTIIIDEVDAFPYSMDTSLQQAVQKAKKQTSATIYLTATPSRQMQNAYRKGTLQAVTIPARYHRKPIPVPTMKWSGNWQKQFQKKQIPPQIQSWVRDRIECNIPILLFFPSIKVMKESLPLFQEIEPRLLAVYSEDPERKEKVTLLRNGEIPGLLTTTILERGVTIPRLDVAVIGAEHQVFVESALVQISGRVGRSVDHPIGNITFFHYGKSEEMVKAILHIENMNREASKRGLLDV